MIKRILYVALGLTLLALSLNRGALTQAAEPPTVKCGDIIEGEFTELPDELTYYHYFIELKAGDKLTVKAETLEAYMTFGMALLDESETTVVGRSRINETPILEPEVLKASGVYRIFVTNHTEIFSTSGKQLDYISGGRVGSGKGKYRLSIDCILRDGTTIKAGSNTPQATTPNAAITIAVDFSSIAKIPLPADLPMGGAITSTGSEIIGYTIDGKAGTTLDLSFKRTAGNLNLGIVILSADNQVVFQASLISTKQLTADVTLPSDGQYTIGVFRVDLAPPADPQATAFQIQVNAK